MDGSGAPKGNDHHSFARATFAEGETQPFRVPSIPDLARVRDPRPAGFTKKQDS